jgi:hypothetical protein
MNVAFCFQVGKLDYEEAGIPALFIPWVVVSQRGSSRQDCRTQFL